MEFTHVEGQALFCGDAVGIIMDYRSNKLDKLTSVEVENSIITRISESAIKHVAVGADYNEVQRVVALAYKAHRPGSQGQGIQPVLFYRVTHIRSLVFSIIDGIVPLPRGADADPDKKNKKDKAKKSAPPQETKEETPAPSVPGATGPMNDFLDK